MFEKENEWNFKIMSLLVNKVGKNNIKYTIPISDWAALLSVADIFMNDEISGRNMFLFNYHMSINQLNIYNELNDYQKNHDKVFDVFKKTVDLYFL